jgi:ubiquinone biosynthesis protein
VHHARLRTGEDVIVKVQRKDVYHTMARDIRLLHHAARLLPPVGGLKNVVDLNQVLEEMWRVAQEEMNFLKEADNLEEFALCNRDVAFVGTPKLYREYSTSQVLVLEYISGRYINEKDSLLKGGYDLSEIGTKLVDNYIKQVMEDGFFHADPHPGNIKIRNGKIIWLDLGMMGRLTNSDRRLLGEAIRGIASQDTTMVVDAILAIGEFTRTPDREKLYRDIHDIMNKYGETDIRDVDIAVFIQDILETMKTNHIRMPHGLSMLARGLTHIEGVLADICPDINMVDIAQNRMAADYLDHFSLRDEISKTGSHLYRAARKTVAIPELLEQALKEYMNGQSHVNMELRSSARLAWLLRKLVQNIVIGMWVMALLISSSIVCTTGLKPHIFGMPALAFAGYTIAVGIVFFLAVRHIFTRPR